MDKDFDFEPYFLQIKKRYAELKGKSSSRQNSFLEHVKSLGQWENDPLESYPTDATAAFPETLSIAYAVCHEDCGRREFIIEGSTQECQRCGRNMFRTDVQEYKRK